jgi:hypothetical protein
MSVYKRPNPPNNEFHLPTAVRYGVIDLYLADEGPSAVRFGIMADSVPELLCEMEAHFHGDKASDILKACEDKIDSERKRVELLQKLKFKVHECE